MKAERQARQQDQERPAAGAGTVMPALLSVPVWDITDEQIEEWKQSRSGVAGACLAGYTAAAIRDGEYDNGQELYARSDRREVTQETIDHAMTMLMDRGMTRRSGDRWYPVVPGRMAPSLWRAVGTLLDRRDDLPAALAAELESWKRALYALNAPGDTPGTADDAQPGQAVVRALRPAKLTLTSAAGLRARGNFHRANRRPEAETPPQVTPPRRGRAWRAGDHPPGKSPDS